MTSNNKGGIFAAIIAAIVAIAAALAHKTPPPTTTPPHGDSSVVVVTPPPTDTSVVVVTPPPATTYRTLVADSINYKTTAELQARVTSNCGGSGTGSVIYTDGVNCQLAVVDTAVRYQGHPTIRYTQAAGDGTIPEMWMGIPPSSHFWLHVAIRFSPGWSTNGTTAGQSKAYKLLGWNYTTVDGSGRLEITNSTQYDFYWGMFKKNTTITVGGGTHTNAGQIAGEWTDGQWYNYYIEVDNTKPTAVTRYWLQRNSETAVLRGTTTGTMVDGSLVPNVDAVNYGMNFNNAQRAGMPAQSLWYGIREVVDGNKYPDPYHLSTK